MKGITGWGYRPYTLLNDRDDRGKLFIDRLAPSEGGFTVGFTDIVQTAHHLLYRKRGEEAWQKCAATDGTAFVEGLPDHTDYECRIEREDLSARSLIRLVRTGAFPGTVINYLHPEDDAFAFSGHYPCSPSLLVLPDGKMLASMDIYAPRAAQNLTMIYESADGGRTWTYVTDLYPCFWGKLFLHRGKVYMLAMSCEYGDLLIGVSGDEGRTWSAPVRLFNGSNARQIGPHKAPMPVLHREGRLYTAIDYGSWDFGTHDNCILSADEDADLMDPESWHLTPPTAFDPAWEGLPTGTMSGCIEGNVIDMPDGKIVNMLRLGQSKADPCIGNAVLLRYIGPDTPLSYERTIDFPLGANSKFIVFKEKKWYIAVGNEAWDPGQPAARNVLSVAVSPDLIRWKIAVRVIDKREEDAAFAGFQYPDAVLCGEDLLILSRTAWNGAHNRHDSNCITFHRISGFASLPEQLFP